MSIPTPPNGMVSNTELILRKILGEDVTPLPPNSRVEFYLIQVEEYIERLATGATRPIGETTTPLTDGATTNPITIDGESYTAQINDLVFYGNKEFLFTVNGWREVGDLTNLNADMIDDTNTTKKFTNATEKAKVGRIVMDSTETQDYYMQDSTPSSPSEGDYWFSDEPIVSADVSAMTGYAKAQSASAISATDTLNEAVGKLEKKADDNTTGLSSKQNQVLGSWTAGTATSHVTPAGTDTVLQALQKIDNNQRNDENNISMVKEKTDKIYVHETEPTDILIDATWLGTEKIIQKYIKTANLSPDLTDYTDGYISGTGNVETASVDKKEKLSDYITIDANTAYIFSAQPDNFPTGATAEDTAWKGVAFYTENKSFISRSATQGTGEYAVTSPNNAAYARLMLRTYGATPHIMFNAGANALPYTPQYKWIDTDSGYKSYNVKGINHRGYNTVAPENTMPAYILSKKMGFEYVETDISFTSDGVAVLLHDSSIDRTSDGTGNIEDMTYAQVLQYDFGSWKSAEYTGTKIPTFDEFIKFCRNVGLKVYAELKGSPTQTQVDTVCNIVKKYNMENQVSWISFDSTALEKVLTNIPTARVGFLVSTASTTSITTTVALKTSDNTVFVDCSSISDSVIADAITANVPVEIWTVNSAAKITAANGYITGFTSDSLNASTVVADISMY